MLMTNYEFIDITIHHYTKQNTPWKKNSQADAKSAYSIPISPHAQNQRDQNRLHLVQLILPSQFLC